MSPLRRAQLQLAASIAFLVAVFAVGLCVKYFMLKAEADTYNRLTGADVTWWDALWVEFRASDKTVRGQ